MELLVKKKEENKALNRTSVFCEISYDKAMPSRKEIREAICAAIGASPELLVVLRAQGSFGSNKADVVAYLYKDKAALSSAKKHLLVRDGLIEKEKKAAKAAPAKK